MNRPRGERTVLTVIALVSLPPWLRTTRAVLAGVAALAGALLIVGPALPSHVVAPWRTTIVPSKFQAAVDDAFAAGNSGCLCSHLRLRVPQI